MTQNLGCVVVSGKWAGLEPVCLNQVWQVTDKLGPQFSLDHQNKRQRQKTKEAAEEIQYAQINREDGEGDLPAIQGMGRTLSQQFDMQAD